MKRYHIAAVLCLIFGGLLAYTRFHHSDTGGAIRTGIIFALLGIVGFFYGKLRTRFRPAVRPVVGVVLPVILIGLMAAQAAFTGDITWAVILGIGLIIGIILQSFEDTRFVKEKIRPWLRPIPYIGLAVMFIITLLLLFRG